MTILNPLWLGSYPTAFADPRPTQSAHTQARRPPQSSSLRQSQAANKENAAYDASAITGRAAIAGTKGSGDKEQPPHGYVGTPPPLPSPAESAPAP